MNRGVYSNCVSYNICFSTSFHRECNLGAFNHMYMYIHIVLGILNVNWSGL